MGLIVTYRTEIKPELLKLKSKGQKIDLLIITHIDQDHIQGAIDFFKDNGANRSVIDVEEVWHNSFRHLQLDKKDMLSGAEKLILDKIISQNKPVKALGRKNISAKQGSSLAALLIEHKYNWNNGAQSNAICIEQKSIYDFSHFKIHLLSPDRSKLKKLESFWLRELNKKKYNFSITDDAIFDDAFEFFMMNSSNNNHIKRAISSSSGFNINNLALVDAAESELDTSPTNGSTIAFILEFEDKNVLFLGDSHEDIIIESLEKKYKNKKCYFDAVKIPHHGSNNNFSTKLSGLINSNKYLISTNASKHDHPNMEVISKIMVKPEHKIIYFNYEHHVANIINNCQYINKYNFEISFSNYVEI